MIYGFNAWVYQITVATFLYKETHSTLAVGIQLTCAMISSLLSSVVLNNITQNQKYLMVEFTQTVSVISACAIAFLAYQQLLSPHYLYFFALINGFAHSSYTGIRTSILMEFDYDKKMLSSINTRISSINKMIGPLIVGVLLFMFNSTIGFFMNALLLLINRIVLHYELKKLGKLHFEVFNFIKLFQIDNLKQVIFQKDTLLKYYIFVSVFFSGYTLILPKVIYHSLSLNEIMFSMTYTATGFAGMCNSLLFPKLQEHDVKNYLKFNIVLLFFSVVGIILNANAHLTFLTFACLFLTGWGLSACILSLDYLNHQTDQKNFLKRNSAFALVYIAFNVLSYQLYSGVSTLF